MFIAFSRSAANGLIGKCFLLLFRLRLVIGFRADEAGQVFENELFRYQVRLQERRILARDPAIAIPPDHCRRRRPGTSRTPEIAILGERAIEAVGRRIGERDAEDAERRRRGSGLRRRSRYPIRRVGRGPSSFPSRIPGSRRNGDRGPPDTASPFHADLGTIHRVKSTRNGRPSSAPSRARSTVSSPSASALPVAILPSRSRSRSASR